MENGIDLSKYKKMNIVSISINGEETDNSIIAEEIIKNNKITVDMVVEENE